MSSYASLIKLQANTNIKGTTDVKAGTGENTLMLHIIADNKKYILHNLLN